MTNQPPVGFCLFSLSHTLWWLTAFKVTIWQWLVLCSPKLTDETLPVFAFEPQVLFWRFHDVWAEGTFLPNSGILSTTSQSQPPTCFCHKHHLGMASSYWYWGLHRSAPSTCWPGLTLNLMQNVGSSEITVKMYKLTTNEASSAGIFYVLSNISYSYWAITLARKLFSCYKAKGADIL